MFASAVLAGEDERPAAIPEQTDGISDDEKEFRPKRKTEALPEDMIAVEGGCFVMGDIFGDGNKDEKPAHRVCLDDFYMDKYEVTNVQFERFKPDFYRSRKVKYIGGKVSPGDNHPVVMATWREADGYCASLGKRLPTEAEWEYAARSRGRKYKYSWGNGEPTENIADEYAKREFTRWKIWNGYDDGYSRTAPVGSFKANDLGLYDISGNVWEWVADWYDRNYYSHSPQYNPRGPGRGVTKVLRGGSWYYFPELASVSFRHWDYPDEQFSHFGFRCAK